MGTATTTNLVDLHYERSTTVCMLSAIALVMVVLGKSAGKLAAIPAEELLPWNTRMVHELGAQLRVTEKS